MIGLIVAVAGGWVIGFFIYTAWVMFKDRRRVG